MDVKKDTERQMSHVLFYMDNKTYTNLDIEE